MFLYFSTVEFEMYNENLGYNQGRWSPLACGLPLCVA